MPYKRIAAAMLLLCAAVYCRLCMPTFYKEMIPAVREAISYEQLALPLPERITAWLSLD